MRLVPLAILVAVAGCYQIDADVTGLTASAGQESFDAAGVAAGQVVAIDRTLSFDGGSSLAKLVRAARLDAVTLSPSGGVTSLDFLSSLTLTLHTPGGDVPLVDASGNMTAPDGSVRLTIARDIDPSLLAAPIVVDASVRFVAPAAAWAMKIDAALTVRGHVDVTP